MKYHIITYGCQMNKSDSERIAAVLENVGFGCSPSAEEADLIVVNICSVRQSAVDRATSKIKNLFPATATPAATATTPAAGRDGYKILLTGCILDKDKRNFKKYCDGIFEIDKLQELPKLLEDLRFKIKETDKKKVEHYLQINPEYQSEITAYVPIMTGCNNFCAYCVVPYVRGREISRAAEDILCEVKNLVKRGVKEIWLLGQNVNSYKSQIPMSNVKPNPKSKTQNSKFINFAGLLKNVNNIPGNFWIRFTSSHPKDLSDEMIEAFAKCQKATPYFNLPIQSGDDKILKAMNRPYTVEKYKTLIKKVRSAFKKYRQGLEKELAISTDVIVGFPGETERHFENTKKTFKDVSFAFSYVSRYSPRPQTAALKLKDGVSSQEKKKREKELLKIVEKSALDFNKKFLNKAVDVLILKKQNDFYLGKTRHYQSIKITNEVANAAGTRGCQRGRDALSLIGKFVKAKVVKVISYGLEGKITN